MHALTNPWKRYAWGSIDVIPALLGVEPDGAPVAEVWVGAHEAAPSLVHAGAQVGLDRFIAEAPQETLGAEVLDRFGPRLPFMAKLLAAEEPLSLQVHPSSEQAAAGFEAEDRAGIDRAAPERSYRDTSHKPEMLYALTEMDMLGGFRSPGEVRRLLEGLAVSELARVIAALDGGEAGLRDGLATLLTAGQPERLALTRAAVRAVGERSDVPEYRLLAELEEHHRDDVGVVASLFLEHVRLSPGDAVYVPPGMIHSYLRGFGLEVMATSDNVVRAGLSTKHQDVEELLRITAFRPGGAQLLTPEPAGDGAWFRPPIADFGVWVLAAEGAAAVPCPAAGPRLVVSCAGRASLATAGGDLELGPGEAAFVPADDGPLTVSTTGLVAVAHVGSGG